MNTTGRTQIEATLRTARRGWRVVALFAILGLSAGCSSSGQMSVSTSAGFGPTVAFESVDGPPPQVFERLVRALENESASRSFSIVSREAPAAYRIRSYLSAQVRRGKTTIVWVWDVYDRDQQRALRLTGEEPGGKSSRDAWAAADEPLIRKIAIAGLSGVSSMIKGTLPDDNRPAPGPSRNGPAVASNDANPAESGSLQRPALAFNAH